MWAFFFCELHVPHWACATCATCAAPGCCAATETTHACRLQEAEAGGDGPLIMLAQDADGAYIIDRDGPSFRYVLNYLRNETEEEIPLPADGAGRQVRYPPITFAAKVCCWISIPLSLHSLILHCPLTASAVVGDGGRVLHPGAAG